MTEKPKRKKKYWVKVWIRHHHDDMKVAAMEDRMRLLYYDLILIAGRINEDGYLPAIEDLMFLLRFREHQSILVGMLNQLRQRQLVDIRPYPYAQENRWYLLYFEKQQSPSSNAERQRRYRERQRESKQAELLDQEETAFDFDAIDFSEGITEGTTEGITEGISYSNVMDNVTVSNESVTNRYGRERVKLEDTEIMVQRGWAVIQYWLNLAGSTYPSDKTAAAEHFLEPANDLMSHPLISWNQAAAAQALEQKRMDMIRNKLTPRRLSGIVPHILAELDLAQAEAEAQQRQPVPADIEDKLNNTRSIFG